MESSSDRSGSGREVRWSGPLDIALAGLVRPSVVDDPRRRRSVRVAYVSIVVASIAWLTARMAPFGNDALVDELAVGNRLVSRLTIAGLFVVFILAGWAAASFSAAGDRHVRLVVGIVVTVGACSAMWVQHGVNQINRTAGLVSTSAPQVRFHVPTVPTVALAFVLAATSTGVVLLVLPGRLLRRRPMVTATLAVVPIATVFAVWLFSAHSAAPLSPYFDKFAAETRERLQAPGATQAVAPIVNLVAAGLTGVLTLVALVDAVEIAQAKSALSAAARRYRRLPGRGALIAIIAVKLAIVGLGAFGAIAGGTGPDGIWEHGTSADWAGALVVTLLGLALVTTVRRRTIQLGTFRQHSMLLVGCLALPSVLLLVAASVSLTVGWSAARSAGRIITWFVDRSIDMTRWSVAVAVLVAAGLWAAAVRKRSWSDGTVLVAAFTVWAAVPALTAAVSSRADSWVPPAKQLDVVVTIVVLVMLANGRIRRGDVRIAAAIVVVSTLIGYGDEVFPASARHRWFLLVFLAPVAWKFLVDNEELEAPSGRPLVVSLVGWSLLFATSALAFAGTSVFAETTWDLAGRLEWRVLMVPLCFAWVCTHSLSSEATTPAKEATAEARALEDEAIVGGLPAEEVASPEGAPPDPDRGAPSVRTARRRWSQAAGVVVAGLLVAGSVEAVIEARKVASVHRPPYRIEVELARADVLPACSYVNGTGEGFAMTKGSNVAVIAEHNVDGANLIPDDACDGLLTDLLTQVRNSGVCQAALPAGVTSLQIGELRGGEALVARQHVGCVNQSIDGAARVLLVYVFGDDSGAEWKDAVEIAGTIEFDRAD